MRDDRRGDGSLRAPVDRYRDRALIQPFVAGDDVRVSFMDTGGRFVEQLGVDVLIKDAASETGGAFMTMKDNETLSGARDVSGTRGGFGASHEAAFVPRMADLRRSTEPRSRRAVGEIVDDRASRARRRPARLFLARLQDRRRRENRRSSNSKSVPASRFTTSRIISRRFTA